ncbi:hypothetical protein E2C01_046527 [Portunus trituberculatus]|uniref:Uncharacterized protein n=1 Tax=Portunus trituberculatus TaxID=210409 RepID=A0A5B7FYU6_PORTR|nr:hypothetical protein [Portunus trituberculatus]
MPSPLPLCTFNRYGQHEGAAGMRKISKCSGGGRGVSVVRPIMGCLAGALEAAETGSPLDSLHTLTFMQMRTQKDNIKKVSPRGQFLYKTSKPVSTHPHFHLKFRINWAAATGLLLPSNHTRTSSSPRPANMQGTLQYSMSLMISLLWCLKSASKSSSHRAVQSLKHWNPVADPRDQGGAIKIAAYSL